VSGGRKVESAAGLGRFKAYPAYRDSGVELLGDVPMHWEVRKTTWLFTIGSGTTPRSGDPTYYGGDMPWVTTSELRESVVVSTDKSVTDEALRDFSSLKVHPKGSVALAMYGATIGRLGILGVSATVNQACCVFSNPNGIDMWFWFYWLQMRRSHLISLGYGGGQPNLSQELLRSVRVPTRPIPEQRAIVAFLDRETANIDVLVAKEERLTEVLEEKRTAIITRAVTKGLDPHVLMKASGVEWLEDIPAHWEAKRIKHISSVENSGAYGVERGEGAVDLPVCTTAHVTSDGRFLIGDMPLRGFSTAEEARYFGRPGDLFVVKSSGSNTNIISGKLALVGEDTPRIVFGNFLMRIRPSIGVVRPRFLAFLLRSELTRERIQRMVATTTYPNIDVPEYVGSALAIPPVEEQDRITAFLDQETTRIDALVAKVRDAIGRLKELRTALISAAVTGKIDIREGAA
jgi:type I restriction enzyme S subunit